jgi:hypothetical protein
MVHHGVVAGSIRRNLELGSDRSDLALTFQPSQREPAYTRSVLFKTQVEREDTSLYGKKRVQ